MSRKRKLILFNLGLLTALLVIAEIGVRLFTQRNMPFDERLKASIQYEPNGLFRFQPKPSQQVLHGNHGSLTDSVAYRINAWSLRGNDIALEKRPDEIRVAILGGSHVFDVNALDCRGNTGWPSNLPVDRNVTLINAGIPGANTHDFPARILHQLRPLHPDHIILLSEWNDLKWIHAYPSRKPLTTPPKAIEKDPLVERVNGWDKALGWSAVYRKLRDAYWKRNRNLQPGWAENTELAEGPIDVQEGLRQYEANLRLSIAAARTMGAEVSLCLESRLAVQGLDPNHASKIRLDLLPQIETAEQLAAAYAACDSVIRLVAKSEGVQLLNEGVDGIHCPECFADHTHYTDAGSRKAASSFPVFLQPDSLPSTPEE